MRARLTILAALVVGVLMMGTGGALAGSALSTGSTAAQGEYHGDGHGTGGVHGSGGNGSVLGQGSRCTENGSGANGSGNTGSSGSSSSNEACSRQFAENDVQASGQAESSGSGTLPFTGFLAIPVLLLGVGLVGSGVVLRRRLDSERS